MLDHGLALSHEGFQNETLALGAAVEGDFTHFPCLREVREEYSEENFGVAKFPGIIHDLYAEFQERFQDFSDLEEDIQLFSSPFNANVSKAPGKLQMELIELQCDHQLKIRFTDLSLLEFYKGRFPHLLRHAQKMTSLFASTYICEQTFSIMKLNKDRLRSTLMLIYEMC